MFRRTCLKRFGSTGFSLVHLLVVIAIIAVAIALVIPAIGRVDEQANLAHCKDNLRRMGSALALYAQTNRGSLPVSLAVDSSHEELLQSLVANKYIDDPHRFYCPSLRDPHFSYSNQNFHCGVIGYYYYSAMQPSANPDISKFLRSGVTWPRKVDSSMDPKTWVMSDIWVSAVPTAHPGYRKGVNYLMLDGSVGFVGESPRWAFH